MPHYWTAETEAHAQTLLARWRDDDDQGAADELARLALHLCQEFLRRNLREHQRHLEGEAIGNFSLRFLRFARRFNPARGRLFSLLCKMANSALLDAVNAHNRAQVKLARLCDAYEAEGFRETDRARQADDRETADAIGRLVAMTDRSNRPLRRRLIECLLARPWSSGACDQGRLARELRISPRELNGALADLRRDAAQL